MPTIHKYFHNGKVIEKESDAFGDAWLSKENLEFFKAARTAMTNCLMEMYFDFQLTSNHDSIKKHILDRLRDFPKSPAWKEEFRGQLNTILEKSNG
jgi:uncharacterized membrane protein YheB (UPF0754 family)